MIGTGAIGAYYGVRPARAEADGRCLLRSESEVIRQRSEMSIGDGETRIELRPLSIFKSTTPMQKGPAREVFCWTNFILGSIVLRLEKDFDARPLRSFSILPPRTNSALAGCGAHRAGRIRRLLPHPGRALCFR